jgi:hypothetical protein
VAQILPNLSETVVRSKVFCRLCHALPRLRP